MQAEHLYTCIKGFKREVLFCEWKWSELCHGSLIETEISRQRKLAEEREKKLVIMKSFWFCWYDFVIVNKLICIKSSKFQLRANIEKIERF